MERALAICEKKSCWAGSIPNTAKTLNRLRRCCAKSRATLRRGGRSTSARWRSSEKVLGPEHPETTIVLYGLACLLRVQGYFEAARRLFERALATTDNCSGPSISILRPSSRHNLATELHIRVSSGSPFSMERALAILEKTFGNEHQATTLRAAICPAYFL